MCSFTLTARRTCVKPTGGKQCLSMVPFQRNLHGKQNGRISRSGLRSRCYFKPDKPERNWPEMLQPQIFRGTASPDITARQSGFFPAGRNRHKDSRIPPWPASGWECRGRCLSQGEILARLETKEDRGRERSFPGWLMSREKSRVSPGTRLALENCGESAGTKHASNSRCSRYSPLSPTSVNVKYGR